MFFFWGDERHVPLDDPDSNYRMAKESLLSKIPVPAANIFPIPADNPDASGAAEAYELTLRKFFALAPGEFPRFDLILLGMGPDGHTASLFPETAALKEKSRLVVANWVEKLNTSRITFTLPVLNAARCVLFLVSGIDKAAALHEVLEGNVPDEKFPSRLVRPSAGKLIWIVDRAAASELSTAV
jgi:6-phosphogluconolactonase